MQCVLVQVMKYENIEWCVWTLISDNDRPSWVIPVAVIVPLLVVVIVIGVIFILRKKRKKRQNSKVLHQICVSNVIENKYLKRFKSIYLF